MPLLIAVNQKINFNEINASVLPQLPGLLRNAAALITKWNNGVNTFQLQTSGSTGKPKTVLLQREKIIYSAKLTAKTFGIEAGDTLFCCLGTNYIAGFMMVMRSLVLDCNLFVAAPNGNPLLELPENQPLHFAAFVPLQMESIYASSEKCFNKLNKMKAVMLGGAAVSPMLEQKIQNLQAPAYHTYSMTETYTHVAKRKLNGTERSAYFYPLQDVKLSLDTRGCLVVQSPITDNLPLITNDLVNLQEDGSFILLGRIDNIINSGGIKIQAEEIENTFKNIMAKLQIPDAELFAYGLKDEKLGQKLVVIIESESWSAGLQKKMMQQFQQKLSTYKIPKQLIFLNQFQRTKTGKIDRSATVEIAEMR